MSEPKLHFPPGTNVSQHDGSVTIHFAAKDDADAFVVWLQWIDKQPIGKRLVLSWKAAEEKVG